MIIKSLLLCIFKYFKECTNIKMSIVGIFGAWHLLDDIFTYTVCQWSLNWEIQMHCWRMLISIWLSIYDCLDLFKSVVNVLTTYLKWTEFHGIVLKTFSSNPHFTSSSDFLCEVNSVEMDGVVSKIFFR